MDVYLKIMANRSHFYTRTMDNVGRIRSRHCLKLPVLTCSTQQKAILSVPDAFFYWKYFSFGDKCFCCKFTGWSLASLTSVQHITGLSQWLGIRKLALYTFCVQCSSFRHLHFSAPPDLQVCSKHHLDRRHKKRFCTHQSSTASIPTEREDIT